MSGRKATEVLLDLESVAQEILHHVRSIDNNIKLLLNNKNIDHKADAIQKLMKQAGVGSPPVGAPVATGRPSEAPLKAETVDFPQVTPKALQGAPRTVQEKLYYQGTDKIILLAQVEIFNESGELVKKVRTNNQGAWTTKLEPGNYRIRVAKGKTKTKPALAVNYNIHVPAGNGPLTLESRKL